ncbi:response regulator transcription factor [Vibrio atypicus]|uniref:response regulator transcription factor n=1 Tax=Vibrio atypicus TaxID=558271 RepID=UPI003735C402
MEKQPINLVASILLAEDDNDLAELIKMHLKFQGHQVTRVQNCTQAMELYHQQNFDLIILDRGLPDGDGLDVCAKIRQRNDWLPVLILTARDSEMDKVDGLEIGVDDYMTKPFSVLEFQARVRNILQRRLQTGLSNTEESEKVASMNFGPLTIHPELHKISIHEKEIDLTVTEFTLLRFLASRPGRVYSKDELLDHVWHTNHSGYHHTVCSTINRLRRKLEVTVSPNNSLTKAQEDKDHRFIQTVWGVGYKFQPMTSPQ